MSGQENSPAPPGLEGAVWDFVSAARVGRLATSSADGAPHVVPVCFAVADGRIYIGLDSKPKSVSPLRLRRARNIVENPRAAFLVDVYDDEDWSRLGYALITGAATMDVPEGERRAAIAALREKYPQYEKLLSDGAPVIRVTPERVSAWGKFAAKGELDAEARRGAEETQRFGIGV